MNIKEAKIIFMGTPNISAYVLEKLIQDGFNIVGIVSQPDRPSGRKREILPTPTKQIGIKYNIPVYQKEKIRKDYDFLKEINPDLILTLAFGQILPEGLLLIPKKGCLNLHGSLLPKYRGAAPIQYALINNETKTGMTLMEMTKDMDAGKIYATKELTITPNDNASSLFTKMADLAYQLAKEYIPLYLEDKLSGIEQNVEEVTFAPSIKKEEEKLNINDPIKKIYGWIRGLSDAPGAYLFLDNLKVKIYKATIYSDEIIGEIGEIVEADSKRLLIQCSDGILSILDLQKEGKSRMDFISFVNGNQNLKGKLFK